MQSNEVGQGARQRMEPAHYRGRQPVFYAKVGTTSSNLVLIKRARAFYAGQTIEFVTLSECEGQSIGVAPSWRGGLITKIDGNRLFIDRW